MGFGLVWIHGGVGHTGILESHLSGSNSACCFTLHQPEMSAFLKHCHPHTSASAFRISPKQFLVLINPFSSLSPHCSECALSSQQCSLPVIWRWEDRQLQASHNVSVSPTAMMTCLTDFPDLSYFKIFKKD